MESKTKNLDGQDVGFKQVDELPLITINDKLPKLSTPNPP